MQRQNIDVNVSARHQDVSTADEGCADNDMSLRRSAGLGPIQNITLNHDVANYEHRGGDEKSREHARHARQECYSPNVSAHGPVFYSVFRRSKSCTR